jgi:DNA-binding NarL/FixJ family response regulator
MRIDHKPTELKIIIADDFRIVVDRLKLVLQPIENIAIAAEANSIGSTAVLTERFRPDVVIMDIQLGESDPKTGIALINLLKQTYQNLTIIVFTNFADQRYRHLCMMNGAKYFFDKASGADGIPDALEEIARLRKLVLNDYK